MKIQAIQIRNYKAFLGTHVIRIGGKNVFIYGENGSGKSSLYYALKDFFQSSIENIDLQELENVFVSARDERNVELKVTFKPNWRGHDRPKTYTWNNSKVDSRDSEDTSIRDANKLKSFLTYKHLLAIHNIKKEGSINLFDLLVNGVLKHFKYPLTGGKELGELWAEIENIVGRPTGKSYPVTKKKRALDAAIKFFNEAFGELFNAESPEHILRHATPILKRFNNNLSLTLRFAQLRPSNDYSAIAGAEVGVDLTYLGKAINKPHLFLNEARLSAIAISIYLGMIKRHVQGVPCKILFLDDIFIGLDISNRLPLLEILDVEFPDYQIAITTYDKPWFEYARSFLEGQSGWKTMEFYAQTCGDGTEIPIVFDDQNLIDRAEHHLHECDYKAAAVYSRSAFERLIRRHCVRKKKAVVFKKRQKDYTTEEFWKVIKGDLPKKLQREIETYRSLVLNTFSHYNTERHEIKPELEGAVKAVRELEAILAKL